MGFAQHIYAALTWAVQPLLRRKLKQRSLTEEGYGVAVEERFGYYVPDDLGRDGRGQWLWLHAVSLGETRAAAILLSELRRQYPSLRLLLTHSTATGREAGRSLLHAGDVQVWLPWDTLKATSRFLKQFQPCIGILMETEVWPVLLAQCQHLKLPVVLANARLNEKSLAGALRWRSLSTPAYQSLCAVWAQTDVDAHRLRQLQAPVQGVFGNLKFDVVVDPKLMAIGQSFKVASVMPVVLLASSREGEEAQWIDSLQALRASHLENIAHVQWLIVPRHPQRFDVVEQMLQSAGWTVSRKSQWTSLPAKQSSGESAPVVWLGDSMGEMMLYYAMADVALMGGSFAELGGQNLIEAAACGCPVVLGPHTFNFAQASDDACIAGAALRAANMQEGVQLAVDIAGDPERLRTMQIAATEFSNSHRGAAQQTAKAIIRIVQESAKSNPSTTKSGV